MNIKTMKKKFREIVETEFHFFKDIHISFISAKTKSGIRSLFEKINEVQEKLLIDIPTSELNNFFFED